MNDINEQTKCSYIIRLFSELNEIRSINVEVKHKGICMCKRFVPKVYSGILTQTTHAPTFLLYSGQT